MGVAEAIQDVLDAIQEVLVTMIEDPFGPYAIVPDPVLEKYHHCVAVLRGYGLYVEIHLPNVSRGT